jgi:toxin ParE1/3/4
VKVYWSSKATVRLREIHDYIAKDSPTRALQVIDRLTLRSARLTSEPRADRAVPEYMQQDIREGLEPPFRIIYLVTVDTIEIVTIKHYRQRLTDKPGDI